MDPGALLSAAREKARYLTHNNNVEDLRYQKFVRPIVKAVTERFGLDHSGLDFGCGTGPVVSKLLQEKGYRICQYDPFFACEPELLERQYDYIVCCEVAEHFYHPAKEFGLLRRLLRQGGSIFIMTLLYDSSIDFSKWFYLKDETHVFLYQQETFAWIKEKFAFADLAISPRLIRLDAGSKL